MFKTKFGISWLDIANNIAQWKVNFSSAENWGEGFIFPVVSFRLNQFRTLLAHWFVTCTVSQLYKLFQNVGIVFPNNTFRYMYNCLLLITPPAWHVPIAMSSTFLIMLSSKTFGLPTFLKTKLSTPVLHLFFQLFIEVLINVNFGCFTENLFFKLVKKLLFVHFANWNSPILKQHESENIITSKLKLTFESLQEHAISKFLIECLFDSFEINLNNSNRGGFKL